MPTAPPPPPEGLLEAVREVAGNLLPRRIQDFHQSALTEEGPTGGLDALAPRPLYHLGLDRLVAGQGLDAAEAVGWRTLVTLSGRVVATADSDAAATPTVTAMNYGPFVGGLASAAESAPSVEEQAGAEGPALEERVLQVPGVYFVGLWFHSADDPARDVVIPAAPAPPGLAAGQAYHAPDVVRILARLAEQRLAVDDHASPES